MINNFLFPQNLTIENWNQQTPILSGNLNEIVAIIIDNGLFVDVAQRLSKDFKKVYYFTAHREEFPTIEQVSIGMGLDNIIKVKDIFEPEDVDIYIFPNTGDQQLQKHLIKMGKIVLGSRKADDLELNRFYGMKKLQEIGLPTPNIVKIFGLDNLVNYLTPLTDKYIKCSYYRGEFETFHYTNINECSNYLQKLKVDLGAIADIFEFNVFNPIDSVIETGADCIVIDGKPSDYIQYGYEIKDLAYVAKWVKYDELPNIIKQVHNPINNLLGQYGYRNLFSSEIRITKNQIPYMIDYTTRFGAPSHELILENVENISDVLFQGAQGVSIPLKIKYTYAVQANIISEWGCENWLEIDFPTEIEQFVKLRNVCKINNKMYCIPQPYSYPEMGTVLGFGNTIEEAIDMCKKNAEQVKGFQLEIRVDALDEALIQIEKGKQLNINF